VKQRKPTRHPGGKPPAKAERWSVPVNFGLLQWVNKSILRAVRLKASEARYERGKDGLTVEFRRGAEVLKTMGPYQRYQDKVIPQLQKMGEKGLPKKCKGQTGGFTVGVDDRVWSMPIFHTVTESGERVVVRFASSKPWKETPMLRVMVKWMLLRPVALGATEVRLEPGKDGLTAKYLKGPRVLATHGFPEHFEGQVIPRLRKLAKMDPAKKGSPRTGKYDAVVNEVVWSFRLTSTATRLGERLVIRLSRAEPGKKPR
jgi:type II secretory ATPase GspE/PulE/Tfp pilus assembly ATPase PilB-like protein